LHAHWAFPYPTFPTQTCNLFVLIRPNTNLTQYEVWNSLGGQCKGYSLLACDIVQFSTLTPEYWSVQHSEDCGNMYLSNACTQNMIKNAKVYPKVSYEDEWQSYKLMLSKPGQLCSVYPPVQAKTASTTHLKLNWVNRSHSEQNGVKKNSPRTEINLIYWTQSKGFFFITYS